MRYNYSDLISQFLTLLLELLSFVSNSPNFSSARSLALFQVMAEEKASLLDSAASSSSPSDSKGVASQLDKFINIVTKPWRVAVEKAYLKECLAELLGTFLLVVSLE